MRVFVCNVCKRECTAYVLLCTYVHVHIGGCVFFVLCTYMHHVHKNMGMCMFMFIWASCVDVRVFVCVYTNDCVYLWLCVFCTMYIVHVYIYVHKHNMGMCLLMLN